MTIKQLTPEEVRTMTVAEKDRWWLANVWKGDMPQLTIRSAATGIVLGGVVNLLRNVPGFLHLLALR